VKPTEELVRPRFDTCVHDDERWMVTLLKEMFCSVCELDIPLISTPGIGGIVRLCRFVWLT
jgi:hypothetical protein